MEYGKWAIEDGPIMVGTTLIKKTANIRGELSASKWNTPAIIHLNPVNAIKNPSLDT